MDWNLSWQVKEHLDVYASFKGIPAKEIPEAVMTKIREVGLLEKVNDLSSNLSGGQRRKLSLAIALIGDPNIISLDEPPSGM